MMLVPKLIAGYSGVLVDGLGYQSFFLTTAALGFIPLTLIFFVAKMNARND
jgi:PAT family beta-lactamase induction signal transducer AmpG